MNRGYKFQVIRIVVFPKLSKTYDIFYKLKKKINVLFENFVYLTKRMKMPMSFPHLDTLTLQKNGPSE